MKDCVGTFINREDRMKEKIQEFHDWFMFGGYPEDIFEQMLLVVAYFIVVPFLLLTLPIWILPYIIYRILKKRAS